MKLLMVGVSPDRTGGMWTVANNFIQNKDFVKKTNLEYVATSTNGSLMHRIKFMIKSFFEIRKKLKKDKFDIVYVHMAEKGSVFRKGYVLKLAKKKKCKTIIQMHAGPIMEWYNSCGRIKKRMAKKIFNRADIFLVLGDYWKKEITSIVNKISLYGINSGIVVIFVLIHGIPYDIDSIILIGNPSL